MVTEIREPIVSKLRLGRPLGRKDSKKRIKKRPVVFRYGGLSVAAVEQ